MTNYRRLISYIYAYEGEAKGKNIGFAKLESRNGQCKLSVNVKKVYVGSSDLGVYLLAPGKEIFLGSIFIRGGSGEFRAAVAVDNAADSGCSMDQCYGLTIHEKGETWRAYTTIWEDAVAQAAELELASVTSENRGNADEQIHKKITELDREIKAQENAGVLPPQDPDNELELIDILVDQEENEFREDRHTADESQMEALDIENLSQNEVEESPNIEGSESSMPEDTVEEQALETAWEQGSIEEEQSNRLIDSLPDIEGSESDSLDAKLTFSQNNEERAVEHQWNEPAAQEIQTVQEAVLKERPGAGMVSGGISMNDAAAALVAAIASNRTAGSGVMSAQGSGPSTVSILPHYANPSPVPTAKSASEDTFPRPVYTDRGQLTPGQTASGTMSMPAGQAASGMGMMPEGEAPSGMGAMPGGQAAFGMGMMPEGEAPSGMGEMPGGQAASRMGAMPASQAASGMGAMPGDQAASGMGTVPGGQRPSEMETMPGGQMSAGKGSMPGGQRPSGKGSMPGGQRPFGMGSMPGGQRPAGKGSVPGGQRPAEMGLVSEGQAPSGMTVPPAGAVTPPIASAPGSHTCKGIPSPVDPPTSGITVPSANASSPEEAPASAPASSGQVSASGEPDPEMSQPVGREQSPMVDAGEETLPLGDPQELARLEEEEQEYYQPQQLWESFRKRYPKIQAFDSANGCEILTIKPQDIGLLPRENWNYGNNSFLLHGYYNYRYLVLARIGGDGGTRIRYILGVPGHYYSNEKYMASMFGFPHFVLSKKQPSQDGRFGYWYTDIRLQNQD